MRVLGIDFTSRPTRHKPIVCVACELRGDRLAVQSVSAWRGFDAFETALRVPGPWIAGADFPFGFARRFIDNIGWTPDWSRYIAYIATLSRSTYRAMLDEYRQARPAGDKEHRRATDRTTGAISPQKLYGTPVGLMLYEGAPRLLEAGVTLPGLRSGDPQRIVVEAYPGVLVRRLIGRRSYKNDARQRQTPALSAARREILDLVRSGGLLDSHGIRVDAPARLAADPGGDPLDALLCAVQAAWAWQRRDAGYGIPADADPLEGWIADPAAGRAAQ